MNCDKIVLLLSDYIDELLDPLEVENVEKHLDNCDSCSEELRKLKQTVNLLHSLPKLSAPPHIIANVNAIIEGKEISPPIIGDIDFSTKKKLSTLNIIRSLSMAAGLMLSFILGLAFLNYKDGWNKKTVALNQENSMEFQSVTPQKKARQNSHSAAKTSREKSSLNKKNIQEVEDSWEESADKFMADVQSSEDANSYGAGAAKDNLGTNVQGLEDTSTKLYDDEIAEGDFDDAKDFRDIKEYKQYFTAKEEATKIDEVVQKNKDDRDVEVAASEELESYMPLQKEYNNEKEHNNEKRSRVDGNSNWGNEPKLPNSTSLDNDAKWHSPSANIGHIMGFSNCSSCHKQQVESWGSMSHSRSLQYFAKPQFQEILKKMDGDIFLCMQCHGSLKDNKFASISCESCHGTIQKWQDNNLIKPQYSEQKNSYHQKHVLKNLKSPTVLLETCYQCHKISNETLINNGHPVINLDVVSGLQKKIKHYPQYNEKRIELLSLISKLMDLRYALKDFVFVQNKGKYLNHTRRSISIAYMKLMNDRNKNVIEIDKVLDKFRDVKINSNNKSELLELIDFILVQEKALADKE